MSGSCVFVSSFKAGKMFEKFSKLVHQSGVFVGSSDMRLFPSSSETLWATFSELTHCGKVLHILTYMEFTVNQNRINRWKIVTKQCRKASQPLLLTTLLCSFSTCKETWPTGTNQLIRKKLLSWWWVVTKTWNWEPGIWFGTMLKWVKPWDQIVAVI